MTRELYINLRNSNDIPTIFYQYFLENFKGDSPAKDRGVFNQVFNFWASTIGNQYIDSLIQRLDSEFNVVVICELTQTPYSEKIIKCL